MKVNLKYAFLAVILILAAAVAACSHGKKEHKELRPTPQVVEGVAGPQIPGATGYSDIAERAVKSVVNISVKFFRT